MAQFEHRHNAEDRGWDLWSRKVDHSVRFKHPTHGFVWFGWHTCLGQGFEDERQHQLPEITVSFYPDWQQDKRDLKRVSMDLAGRGIYKESGTHEVLNLLEDLMYEGLFESLVSKHETKPTWTIDWIMAVDPDGTVTEVTE